ncbi:MAG: hypothetical protein JSU63_01145 [Phycisphaerales bacterium]|nr:MAG: hypothetical protein JSU63_01145 [Phycisphaerales bacterium]
MVKRVTERRLVDVLVCHLRKQHATGREIGHYEKRIDVATIRSDTNELWAIEAKTADWSRALSQAIVNLAAAERSYIALYSKHAHRVPLGTLDEHGVGLIAVGTRWGDVEILREAARSPYTNRLATDRIRLQIAEVKSR